MCLGPELAAGIGLLGTGAGAYANSRAQKATIEEQDRLQQAERLRQANLQAERDAILKDTQATFTPEARQASVATNAAARTASMAPQAAPMPQYQPTTPNAPAVVKSDAERRAAMARTASGVTNQARAQLGAIGDTSLGEAFRLNRAAQDTNRNIGFSNANLGVLNTEMQQAGHVADKWRRNAGIAGAIGKIGNAFAMFPSAGGGLGYGAATGLNGPQTIPIPGPW